MLSMATAVSTPGQFSSNDDCPMPDDGTSTAATKLLWGRCSPIESARQSCVDRGNDKASCIHVRNSLGTSRSIHTDMETNDDSLISNDSLMSSDNPDNDRDLLEMDLGNDALCQDSISMAFDLGAAAEARRTVSTPCILKTSMSSSHLSARERRKTSRASEQRSTLCELCLFLPQYQQFDCGHRACRRCSDALLECAMCGTFITERSAVTNNALLHSRNSSGSSMELEVEETRCMFKQDESSTAPQSLPEDCQFCNVGSAADSSGQGSQSVSLELVCEGGCVHRSCGACVTILSTGCYSCGRPIKSMQPITSIFTDNSPSTLVATAAHHAPDDVAKARSPAPVAPPAETSMIADAFLSFMGLGGGKTSKSSGSGGNKGGLLGKSGDHTTVSTYATTPIHKANQRAYGVAGSAAFGSMVPGESMPRERPPCQICENRPQVSLLVCGSGCKTYACASCTTKRNTRCFVCERKGVEHTLLTQDAQGFNTRKKGCDLCGYHSQEYSIECQHGCRFRSCTLCVRSVKYCCASPIAGVQRISRADDGDAGPAASSPMGGGRSLNKSVVSPAKKYGGYDVVTSMNDHNKAIVCASPLSGQHTFYAVNNSRGTANRQLIDDDPYDDERASNNFSPPRQRGNSALGRSTAKRSPRRAKFIGNDFRTNLAHGQPPSPKQYFNRIQRQEILEQELEPVSREGGFMGY